MFPTTLGVTGETPRKGHILSLCNELFNQPGFWGWMRCDTDYLTHFNPMFRMINLQKSPKLGALRSLRNPFVGNSRNLLHSPIWGTLAGQAFFWSLRTVKLSSIAQEQRFQIEVCLRCLVGDRQWAKGGISRIYHGHHLSQFIWFMYVYKYTYIYIQYIIDK